MLNPVNYVRLKLALQHYQRPPWELSAEEGAELAKQLPRQQALEARILSYAKQSAIQVSAEEVSARLAQLREGYADEESWVASLAQVELSLEEYTQALQCELLMEAVLERVVSAVPTISDEAARAWYVDHPRQFLRPERRRVRHILITINEELIDNRLLVARRRIESLRNQLLMAPMRFAELAERHSECPSALHGGEIGWVEAGQLYPELDAALFRLPEGQMSTILSSPMGFHLLICCGIQEAAPVPMEEALPRIIAAHHERAKSQLQKQWLTWLQQQEWVEPTEPCNATQNSCNLA